MEIKYTNDKLKALNVDLLSFPLKMQQFKAALNVFPSETN